MDFGAKPRSDPQIGIELLEDPIVRGERRQHRRRDRAFLAQHRQPSLERGPVTGLDGLPPASMPEVPLNDAAHRDRPACSDGLRSNSGARQPR